MAKSKASDIPERVAERLTMDYPVVTTPRTTTRIVKGRPGIKPQQRSRSSYGAVLHPDPSVRDKALQVLAGLPELRAFNPDQPRDEKGRFAPGGGSGDESPSIGGVRGALARAKTAGAIGAAASAEALRITGRDIPFDMEGVEPQLAREYSEGVLQGLERFPGAPLGAVRVADFPADREGEQTWAHTVHPENGTSGQYEIEFNRNNEGSQRANEILDMKQARGVFAYGDVRGLALHEFGHVMHEGYGTTHQAYRTAWDHARAKTAAEQPPSAPPPRQAWWRFGRGGATPAQSEPSSDEVRITLMRDLSFYAVSNSHELAAEAFVDVMVNGGGASAASHEIMSQLESKVGSS